MKSESFLKTKIMTLFHNFLWNKELVESFVLLQQYHDEKKLLNKVIFVSLHTQRILVAS